MSKGTVNKVILFGRLGKDPEIRYTPDGTAIANFTMATNDGYKDKNGQYVDQVEWHKLSAFGRTAEIIGQYVKKGASLYIEGKIHTRRWEKDGVDQYSTEIKVTDIQLLGSKSEEANRDPATKPLVDNRPKLEKQPALAQNSMGKFEDDDIPF